MQKVIAKLERRLRQTGAEVYMANVQLDSADTIAEFYADALRDAERGDKDPCILNELRKQRAASAKRCQTLTANLQALRELKRVDDCTLRAYLCPCDEVMNLD